MRNVIVLMLMMVVAVSALGQYSPVIVADVVGTNSPLYYNHASNIARSSNDDIIAVWTSPEDQIVYSKYDEAFNQWSAAVTISNAEESAVKAGIASDNAGNMYCVWQQRDSLAQDYAIYVTKYDGTSWSTPMDISGVTTENEEVSIEVSDQERIFVCWNTGNEASGDQYIVCSTSDDQGANFAVPDTITTAGIFGGGSGTAGRPFIAKASGGKMLVTWHEVPAGLVDREPYISQYDGTSWSAPISYVDAADSVNSSYPTIAADSDDTIYLIYVSYTSPEKMLMTKKAWADDSFETEVDTLIMADDQLTKPFLVIDSSDKMYVGFRRDNPADTSNGIEEVALMISEDKGVTWSEQLRLSRENHDAGYITLGTRPNSSGVDVLWRESYKTFNDDGDTTAIVYGHVGTITSIHNNNISLSNSFTLEKNYPNPFNPTTQINFSIIEAGNYELAVYNLLGKKICTLSASDLNIGSYTMSWNGKNDAGVQMATGVYLYRLSGIHSSQTKKMILLR